MKTKPYFYTLTQRESTGGYGHLEINLHPKCQFHKGHAPVPTHDYTRDDHITLHWQSNADAPHDWYGFHAKLELDAYNFGGSKLLTATRRWLGDSRDPSNILTKLNDLGIYQSIYHAGFHNFVHRHDWEEATQYAAWYDTGIKDNGTGCTVHAYSKSTDQEAGQDAVAKALRNSRYCTDEKFAQWIQAGKPVHLFHHPDECTPRPSCATVYDTRTLFPTEQEAAHAA
jgi:hypothetical protein